MEKLSAKPAPASNSQPTANNPSRAKAKTKSRQTHAPTAIFEPAPVTPLFAPEKPANPAAGLSAEEKKKAEIEALGREIRDRRRQVDLLMRLYVTDERKYLLNMQHHTNTESEKRVDSEQAELHQKALELRHLQEKLQSLQARVNATTAEGKP